MHRGELLEIDNALVVGALDQSDPETQASGVVLPAEDPRERIWLHWAIEGQLRINHQSRARQLETPPVELKGKWLYLGEIRKHFGHLLFESIHRLWALAEEETKDIDGLILLPMSKGNEDWCRENINNVLQVLGLRQDLDIAFIYDPTRVETLLVPQPGRQMMLDREPWYKNFLESRTGTLKPFDGPKKIVVSRRAFTHEGRVSGMNYVLEQLVKKGYFEFQPERYPLERQLQIVAGAEEIVWEDGSAMHLMELLASVKAKQVYLKRRPFSALDLLLKDAAAGPVSSWESTEFVPLGDLTTFNIPSFIPDDQVKAFSAFIRRETGARINTWIFKRAAKKDLPPKLAYFKLRGTEEFYGAYIRFTRHANYTALGQQELAFKTFDTKGQPAILGWALDEPAFEFGTPRIPKYRAVFLKGWVACTQPCQVVASFNGQQVEVPFNQVRQDVVNVYADQGSQVPALCGFNFDLPEHWTSFVISVRIGNELHPLVGFDPK